MDKRLLDIICCPVTQLPLLLLDSERLTRLNAAITAGTLHTRAGQLVAENLPEALITRDSRLVYPVRAGIPFLLDEESIDWQQLG